jgi:putative restriction endonuclease
MATTEDFLSKITKLRLFKDKAGTAPHKPLLLLVVLELAEQGQLPKTTLPLTPELAFRFYSYWKIVAHRRSQRPDVRYPFYHLKTDGFWSALDESGNPSPSTALTRYAALPSDFVRFAYDSVSREKARRILIARYFQPDERVALYALVDLPVPADEQIPLDANYKSPAEALKQGREARFRLNIVAAYNYTCALTGYRLTTITAGSIVDAAHIHPFSSSRNNDPRNGLALCKNAHWAFDNGLWTLTDDYRVVVAVGRFTEDSPDQKALMQYHGQPIRIPSDPRIQPDPIHIAWHRKNRFQGP